MAFLATNSIRETFRYRYRKNEVDLEEGSRSNCIYFVAFFAKTKTVGVYQLEAQGTDVRIILKSTFMK